MLRQFCDEHGLLTFPSWLRRYRNLPLPTYLAPLRHLGVTDDLTSASRLDQDGTCYLPDPSPDLPYFYQAMARDPRTLIAHEGVHYYQLARSWAHDNQIRRQYYDSGPNEGIGFYAEEMLLQAGLFDDSPRSREIIYNFMRLRALRVAVDVRLALGELTIDTAADELARRVPMDAATAREEASMFASEPGQAITYQIGKLQLANSRSCASWRKRGPPRVARSTCARSTMRCGSTATCRSLCRPGSHSEFRPTSSDCGCWYLTPPASACDREPTPGDCHA
jgi:hypothetical protein